MVKRMIVMLFVFMLFVCAACAESESYDESFLDATIEIDKWMQMIRELEKNIDDESIYVINAISVLLDTGSSIMSEASKQVSYKDGMIIGDVITDLPMYIKYDNSVYLESGTQHYDDLGYFYECRMEYTDAYMRLEVEFYLEDGSLAGMQKVEIAQRQDDYLLLLIDYDNDLNMTGRFAMTTQSGREDVLFTKTLGLTWTVEMDVRDWQNGTDYKTWDKALLYPVMF